MADSKVIDGNDVQQVTDREEGALLNAGIIVLAEENLGVLHYTIAAGKSWADVDAVIASV